MASLFFVVSSLAVAFLIVTLLIIRHNSHHFLDLKSLPDKTKPKKELADPVISILIPARNEEKNILRLLKSIDQQDFSGSIEILVLDDHSDDRTREIVLEFSKSSGYPVRIHEGKDKPDDWLGKNWACHQLSSLAQGNVLVFLDADTWLAPSFLRGMLYRMSSFKLDFLTVWPHQVMNSIIEKSVISTVYATIVMYLPTLYSFKAPPWIPTQFLKMKAKPLFASACGQCMVFTKKCYNEIGGHQGVKMEVVEDMKLAKRVVSSGMTMRMFHGTDRIWCRMYQTNKQVFEGFRKNFLAGFDYNLLPFSFAWILHIVVFILPPVFLISILAGIDLDIDTVSATGTAAILTAIPALQRLWVSGFLKWPQSAGWLYLIGIFWFQFLAIIVVKDKLTQKRSVWKGRPV